MIELGRLIFNRVVAQMVERVVWDHEAASSRLAYPTKPLRRTEVFLLEQKQNQESSIKYYRLNTANLLNRI